MKILTIRIKKNRDGTVVFSCHRADGSTTWQRQQGAAARFFPIHDLTHYAVETTLGHRRGFYGLVAEGWEITDFGTPWPRGPMPADADPSELIVGFLDSERAAGTPWTTEQFNAHIKQYFDTRAICCPLQLTDELLALIRQRMEQLFSSWIAVPSGEALELVFEVTGDRIGTSPAVHARPR